MRIFWRELLRTAAWGLLFLQLGMYLGEVVSWTAAILFFVCAGLIGAAAYRFRLRFVFSVILLGFFLWVSRGLLFRIMGFLSGPAGWAGADRGILAVDMTLLPLAVPLILWGAATYAGRRWRGWRTAEPLVLGLCWLAALWSQGGYSVSLYPHPVYLGAVSFLFSAAGLFLTLDTDGEGGGNRRKNGRRRFRTLLFPLLLLPLLTAVLLYILHQYTEGAASSGGGLVKPTLFRFDFSDFVQLESEISMKDDLVLMYHQEGGVEETAYLRRFVLSGYGPNKGFFRDSSGPAGGALTQVPRRPVELEDPGYRHRGEVIQEYYLVNFDPSSFLGIDYPLSVRPFQNWDESSFVRIYETVSMASLGKEPAVTYRPNQAQPAAETWEGDSLPDPDKLSRTAREMLTDYGGDERIQRLAEEITAEASSYYAKAASIEDYLKEEFYYSLKPGVSTEGNQLHHFLFDSRKGYCSYFAFSMALMCRSLGIPARVAVGFWVEPSTGLLHYYPVQANQAHAWVEVYFGPYGWITFDPTSETMAPGENYEFSLGGDPKEVRSLLEEILDNRGELEEENRPDGEEKDSEFSWQGMWSTVQNHWKIVPLLLVFLVYPVLLIFPWLRGWAASRWGRTRERRMRGALALLFLLLRRRGERRRTGETLLDYVRRLETRWGRGLEPLVWFYLEAEYGPEPGSGREKALKQGVRLFIAEAWQGMSMRQRAAVFLRLRGLMGGLQ